MKQTQKDLLAKSMSRREFLQLVIAGILAVFGLHNLLGFLRTQANTTHRPSILQEQTTAGFGRSKFGV